MLMYICKNDPPGTTSNDVTRQMISTSYAGINNRCYKEIDGRTKKYNSEKKKKKSGLNLIVTEG